MPVFMEQLLGLDLQSICKANIHTNQHSHTKAQTFKLRYFYLHTLTHLTLFSSGSEYWLDGGGKGNHLHTSALKIGPFRAQNGVKRYSV